MSIYSHGRTKKSSNIEKTVEFLAVKDSFGFKSLVLQSKFLNPDIPLKFLRDFYGIDENAPLSNCGTNILENILGWEMVLSAYDAGACQNNPYKFIVGNNGDNERIIPITYIMLVDSLNDPTICKIIINRKRKTEQCYGGHSTSERKYVLLYIEHDDTHVHDIRRILATHNISLVHANFLYD